MALIVLVQRSREDADRYQAWLLGPGRAFRYCGGPSVPGYTCAFQREGACDFWQAGDLFVYDAWLDKSRYEANSNELVAALRRRYPHKPLVLVGPGPVTPTWVERLMRADPLVRAVFPVQREQLTATVAELLAQRPMGAAAPALF
jgi:hypothetical protein